MEGTNNGFKGFIKEKIIILDGAMGTMLQKSGLKIGEIPESFNVTAPDVVASIHRGYLEAGCDIVYANTFGANEKKLIGTGYTPEELISAGVKIAKAEARKFGKYAALDVGPIGELLEPMGTLSFESAYEIFKRQMVCGEKSGADLIVIETVTDLLEAKAAVLAAKENTSLPVICTMSFEQNKRTFTGCTAASTALTLSGLGVDALGVNCSLGPKEMLPIVEEILKYTTLPVVVKANAGLPNPETGRYTITADEFAKAILNCVNAGACLVGGCCGTDTEFIKAVSNITADVKPVQRDNTVLSAVCSPSCVTDIDGVRVIGERINPTGKKLFKQALIDCNMDYIIRQAVEQAEACADILDVNVGIPDINEKDMMIKTVKAIQSVVKLPLQIDSSDAEVIEAALRVYNGKAIVNSVNGETATLNRVLPIVKKYGAAVVGLTLDERGIPETAEGRFAIAEKIVAEAVKAGISKSDIYIDCLTLTVSAQQKNAAETLKALKMVKDKLGVKTVLGVSNISFGLPNRELINRSFLTMALEHGLDLPIINPNSSAMMDTVFSYNVLCCNDIGSAKYIERFANTDTKPQQVSGKRDETIGYYIEKGLKDECRQKAQELLAQVKPIDVVNKYLIPALDEVGAKYEKGTIFLPQLIQSAETAKEAFEEVKKGNTQGRSQGREKDCYCHRKRRYSRYRQKHS